MSRSRAFDWRAGRVPPALLLAVVLATAGARPSPARAQEAPAPGPAGAAEPKAVGDLTARYRFVERYALAADREKPGQLTQYRVALREAVKTTEERAQGAPLRRENTFQTIYTERAAQADPTSGEASAVVRAYEAFRPIPDPPGQAAGPRPLEGLTLWIAPRAGQEPLVLCLTPGRGLRDLEFRVVTQQPFLPALARLMPALPSRIGDRWRIPTSAAQALLGMRPRNRDPLTGTLVEMRQSDRSENWVAVVTLAGRLNLQGAEAAVNARLLFEFPPPKPPERAEGAAEPGREPEPLEAVGAITEVRMALSTTFPLPEAGGRLRRVVLRELVLARQPGARGVPLDVPDPPPTPDRENSWLTYDDPRGRFHFRHPERLLPSPGGGPDDPVLLAHERPEGPDTVELDLLSRTGDPAEDRGLSDPESFRKNLKLRWAEQRIEVIQGASGWLPQGAWGRSKKVYRVEAVFKPGGRPPLSKGAQRLYADHYLVLFSRNETLYVTSITAQDPPAAHRKDVEDILKTFEIGPSAPPASAGTGAPAPGAARTP